MNRIVLLGAALGVFAFGAAAQQAVSHIVVLKEGADLRGFAQQGALPPGLADQDPGVAGAVQYLERKHAFTADFVYSHAIRGFAARLNKRQVEDLRNSSLVDYIEADGEMRAIAQTLPWGINKIEADLSSARAGDGAGTISNVHVYVIDTGVSTSHPDLNVVSFVNFAGGPNDDCNGHGSHVAGTVAAKDNTSYVVGVAPGAPIHAVKVLGCSGSGSTSGVIKGVDWVTANASLPAVANMSLGGGVSTALDDAVRKSVAKGVFYALAAGNEGANACNSSPARAGAGTNNGILTVAAVDSSEREASWSNYGSCVDIWAPGVSILSTYRGSGTATMSGTSMASPHGAGGGALYLSTHPGSSPSAVEGALKSAAVATGTASKDGTAIQRLDVRGF